MKNFIFAALALYVLAAAPGVEAVPIQTPAPKLVAAPDAKVRQLFARATRVYGQAEAVKMEFSTGFKLEGDSITARGSLIFQGPAKFRFEHTLLGDKTIFVYDGYTLSMQSEGENPSRVVVKPNQTVWDALPDAFLPDPLIDSLLAGENPLEDFEGAEVTSLAPQTIGGALCDGARIAGEGLSIAAYFNRESGALQRVVTVTDEVTLTSNYSQFELDPELQPNTFTLSGGTRKTKF